LNHALDFALGARAPHAMGLDGEAVMRGEVHKPGMQFTGAEAQLFHVVVPGTIISRLLPPQTKSRSRSSMKVVYWLRVVLRPEPADG